MNNMNGNRSSLTRMLGGLAVGALAMYVFDPVHGNRRRALIRDKLQSMADRAQQATQTTQTTAHDLRRGAEVPDAGSSVVDADVVETVSPGPGTTSQSSSAP